MKPLINLGCILSGALLISVPSFSQVKTNYSLTQSKKEVKMGTDQSQEKNKAAVRKLYEDILNTGKLELLDQVIAEDYIGVLGENGPAGFAQAIAPVRMAFPDIKWTIEDLIAEGDKVMAKWSWKGTNTSSFNGIQPTHKEITHHAVNIFQFSDGKIIKAWMESDRLGFFQQIGVIPPGLIPPPLPVKK
jgi:predicted ester cyclase